MCARIPKVLEVRLHCQALHDLRGVARLQEAFEARNHWKARILVVVDHLRGDASVCKADAEDVRGPRIEHTFDGSARLEVVLNEVALGRRPNVGAEEGY